MATPKNKPSTPSAKKSVRPSTTRETAGPGHDFEDRVGAWLLLTALAGEPLPGIGGTAVMLQTQVEAGHWHIDDILLTTVVSGEDRRLAISCKSNVQVTSKALPADFVTRCWQQWSKPEPNPMVRGRDRLALVTRGRNSAFMATWSELKNAAVGADVELAIGRMRANAKYCALFDSVKNPAQDAGVAVSDTEVVAMIDSIFVEPLDFQLAESQNERDAVGRSRRLLVNGSLAHGMALWEDLVGCVRDTRLGSGTLAIEDLWERLRTDNTWDRPRFRRNRGITVTVYLIHNS